jgi:hypothetical protein
MDLRDRGAGDVLDLGVIARRRSCAGRLPAAAVARALPLVAAVLRRKSNS